MLYPLKLMTIETAVLQGIGGSRQVSQGREILA